MDTSFNYLLKAVSPEKVATSTYVNPIIALILGWYFLNESGEVASCEQIAANPQLVQNPIEGHPVPLGHHPERGGLGHRHRTEDQIYIDQPIRKKQSEGSLEKGMEVTHNFFPEAAARALFTKSKVDAVAYLNWRDTLTANIVASITTSDTMELIVPKFEINSLVSNFYMPDTMRATIYEREKVEI